MTPPTRKRGDKLRIRTGQFAYDAWVAEWVRREDLATYNSGDAKADARLRHVFATDANLAAIALLSVRYQDGTLPLIVHLGQDGKPYGRVTLL